MKCLTSNYSHVLVAYIYKYICYAKEKLRLNYSNYFVNSMRSTKMENEETWILQHEVKEIRNALSALENRLRLVEASLHSPKKDIQTNIPTEKVVLSQTIVESKILPTSTEHVAEEHLLVPKQNLETRIGQYWLNKLGVISLVIGVVFLILYSFQYFGAP